MNQAALGRIVYQQQEQILPNTSIIFGPSTSHFSILNTTESSIQPQRGGSCNSDAETTVCKQGHHYFQISTEVNDRFGKHQIVLLSRRSSQLTATLT